MFLRRTSVLSASANASVAASRSSSRRRLYSICGIGISRTEFSPHVRSVRQRKWLELFKTIAGTGIFPVCLAAEVMHDAPHRIECGLHRALDPARNPRHIITGKKDALLIGRHRALHELTIHAMGITIMPGQRTFEGAEEI